MTEPRRRGTASLRLAHGERRDAESDRRRSTWREFRRAYPGILTTFGVALVIFLLADGWLLVKRGAYRAETVRLRGAMTDVERRRTDLLLASDERRLAVSLELLRRQALTDEALHLSIAVDSGWMTLEREGATLRRVRVVVGPERVVGTAPDTVHLSPPRGKRTVERVLGAEDAWEVPAWVYAERGLPAPVDRSLVGALGAGAVVLSGGTVLYARPDSGPLADSTYVLPGSIRLPSDDLRAVAANIAPGMSVYFY